MGRGTFELEGSEYWDRPVRTSARVIHSFAMERRRGLFLDAPAEADLDRVDRVPVLVLSATTIKDARRHDPWRAGHLVCVRLEDRGVEVIDLFEEREEADPFADEAPDSEPKGEGGSVVTDETDALRLGLLDHPGTYVLTALVRDRVSNRVEIRISGSASADPVKSAPQARPRPVASPEPVRYAPGPSWDGCDVTPSAPVVSEPLGIAMECERIIRAAPGATAWLRGTVRVPVLACEVVPRPPAEDDDGFGPPRPTAIVRVTLVVVGNGDGEATAIPIEVPCFQATPVVPGGSITASFAIDLLQHSAISGRMQGVFVYAFCGEAMTGPVPVEVAA